MLNYGHSGLWTMCNDVFDLLPMAALVDHDVFCVHGGLSKQVPEIDYISLLKRQQELPCDGALADLAWSDPEQVDDWRENTRGAGYLFGDRQATLFCRFNRLNFICRSHQLAMKGYETHFPKETGAFNFRLITVWSAPNYSYRSGNQASVLVLEKQRRTSDRNPEHLLEIFEPNPDRISVDELEKPVTAQYFA
jgi:diadenosine tetraphosphatase ApaH/serine/threonine PP2A family protein phosphatase